MKYVLLIPAIILTVFSCNTTKKDKQEHNSPDNPVSENKKSDFRIIDSAYTLPAYNHFLVFTDTAHFYDLPDSLSKRSEYLLKDNIVEVLDESGDYSFVDHQMQSEKHMTGWVKTSNLKKMLFTTPRIKKD